MVNWVTLSPPGKPQDDWDLNCASDHLPLPRITRPSLLPDQGGLPASVPRYDHMLGQNIDDFPHYVFIWKLTMWVFLVSRTLQPILILTSDKELKLKSKQFVMAES